MELKLKQLKCGQCGEERHRLYMRDNGEVVVKCIECENVSDIRITQPKIVLGHVSGDGIICVS